MSLDAENTNPPTPCVGDVRPTPRFPSPWNPTVPSLTATFGSAAVVLKFSPVPRLNSTGVWSPSSTPASSVLFNCTSAMVTWITTCGGCESILSMIRLISPKYCGVAAMSTVLLTGSAITTTLRWSCW